MEGVALSLLILKDLLLDLGGDGVELYADGELLAEASGGLVPSGSVYEGICGVSDTYGPHWVPNYAPRFVDNGDSSSYEREDCDGYYLNNGRCSVDTTPHLSSRDAGGKRVDYYGALGGGQSLIPIQR